MGIALLLYYCELQMRMILMWASLLVAVVMATQEGVLLLTPQALQEVIGQHQHVVVFFCQDDCKHCDEFSETFTLVAALHAHIALFTKITYSPLSSSFFQQHLIDSTPTVLAFSNGSSFPFRYQPTGSGNSVSLSLFKWIQRLFLSLKQWQGEEGDSHQLIVHCTPQFSTFWQEVSRNQLWLDIYCGSETLLGDSLAMVHEYGRRVEAWQLQNEDFEEVAVKLKRLIRAYKYKYVLTWGPAIAQEIFRNNVSAFVMLVNNESVSRELQGHFQEVKRQWYEGAHNYEPTIFAVADLSLHPQETLRLKRFLTGYTTFSIHHYHYPILAFIRPPNKYLLNLTAPKNISTIGEFISTAHVHLIKGEPYQEGEAELEEWLNEGDDGPIRKQNHESEEEESEVEKEKIRPILLQQNWQDLLIGYERPFFVYFTWRNNHRLCQLEWEFRQWWEGEEAQFAPHRKAFDIFLHMYHTTDLPQFPGLSIDYFPSLYYFTKEKEILRLQGVTDLQKIKQFITQVYKNVPSTSSP